MLLNKVMPRPVPALRTRVKAVLPKDAGNRRKRDTIDSQLLQLAENPPSHSAVVRGVNNYLQSEYGIGHSTIEVEIDGCADH